MDDPEDSENRLYARRQYSTIRQMKSGLPNIPGVFALSKTEVKKDVREMERNVNEDTDSDSSILSEDVLVSSYPVKPRKTPKVMMPVKPIVTGPTDIEREYDGKTVDQTLAFLDAIRRTKKDLYNAECERERLEDQSLSYRLSIEDTSKRYIQVKQDEGNYFRVIQGFHTQALRLQMGLNRQNSMFYDVLTALQRRKEGKKAIASDISKLKNRMDSEGKISTVNWVNGNGNIPISAGLMNGETAVLRVDLKKSGEQVVLFKGQSIRTPMGNATILSIYPTDEKIVLQLPFGKMYSNLRRAVCWGKANGTISLLDLSSDEALRQRWTALQSSFSMSPEVFRGIRELIGQSDDEAVTDKDDDNSNDDSPPADVIIDDVNSNNNNNNNNDIVQNGHIDIDKQETQAATSSSTSSSVFSVLDSSSAICSFPLKGSGRSSVSVPIGGVLSSTLARSALRAVCVNNSSESNISNQMELSRILPIVFAPPASLPYLIEKAQDSEIPEIRYCQQSLSGTPQLGTLGSLVWDGDVLEMSRELITLQDEINRLECEQNYYIGQIQSVRSRCAQLSTDTSALRLAIFTRRVRHRNNLSTHAMSSLANQAAANFTSTSFPPYQFSSTEVAVNTDIGAGSAATLRSTRGGANMAIKEEVLVNRSNTRFVSSIITAPLVPSSSVSLSSSFTSAAAAISHSSMGMTSSSSSSPDVGGEKLGFSGNDSSSYNNNSNQNNEINNCGSRKRSRETTPAVENLTSSRRRNAPISFITEIEDGRDQKRNGNGYAPSSSASQEDDGEDEDEIKEETGSQNIEDEEKGGDLIPLGTGTGTGRGGTRTTNGVGKKKPRKQRRI